MEGLSREQALFAEADELAALVAQCQVEVSPAAMTDVVKRVEEILSKYQEQASLLDMHLPGAILPLMRRIRTVLIERYTADIRAQMVDPSVVLFAGFRDPILHALFQIVYLLSKTRGYKHIVRLLPHEVADLEPALQLLLSQDRAEHSTWETRYVLFLWLSMLVLVPFDLRTADSLDSSTLNAAGGGAPELVFVFACACMYVCVRVYVRNERGGVKTGCVCSLRCYCHSVPTFWAALCIGQELIV